MSDAKLKDKTAVVTGAGRGIGLGCALELARRGANVVLNDRPGSPDLADAVEQVAALGVDARGVEANVFSREGCEELIDSVDCIDILVSNAAYVHRNTFLEFQPDEFDKTIDGVLAGGYHLAQMTALKMIARGEGGKMVFISSVHGLLTLPGHFAYATAKAALNHMTKLIAADLCKHRINVNAITPGWIDTPGEHEAFGSNFIAEESKKLPWSRLGLPEEIGKAAAFLSSPDSDYITGVVLPVDGGFCLLGYGD